MKIEDMKPKMIVIVDKGFSLIPFKPFKRLLKLGRVNAVLKDHIILDYFDKNGNVIKTVIQKFYDADIRPAEGIISDEKLMLLKFQE